jgi:hypothetical protein
LAVRGRFGRVFFALLEMLSGTGYGVSFLIKQVFDFQNSFYVRLLVKALA